MRSELKYWQDSYISDGERRILSCHIAGKTNVRLAVSAITQQTEGLAVSVSVLPRISEAPESNLCDIILTCRNVHETNPMAFESQSHLQERISQLRSFAAEVETLLNSGPTEGIPALVKRLSLNPSSFFFVSPDDYRLIRTEGQMRIEREMAAIAQEFMSP